MAYSKPYYPKKPVKSFQDLEVYQKALAISVAVVKRCGVSAAGVAGSSDSKSRSPAGDASQKQSINVGSVLSEICRLITSELCHKVIKIPLELALAHSCRFADGNKALNTLEDAMLNCNLAVVYLEQYRDICNNGIETEFFEEQVKNLLSTRQKTLYLQRSWKKFMSEYKKGAIL